MAATKLIAMHQNKGRSVMQCLKDRTDYAKNGEKTEDGKYTFLAGGRDMDARTLLPSLKESISSVVAVRPT